MWIRSRFLNRFSPSSQTSFAIYLTADFAQVTSLQNLVARFEGRIDEVNKDLEEIHAVEEAQAQARENLRKKAHRISLAHQHSKESHPGITQPALQPHPPAGSQPFAFHYVGPPEPTDTAMDVPPKNLKRRRQGGDVGNSSNPVREHREQAVLSGGKQRKNGSSISSFYSEPSSPKEKGIAKSPERRSRSTATAKSVAQESDDLNDDDDYGSDTETVEALYESKRAPKDETITQVMTLLNVLVEKVNNLLENVPPTLTTVPKNVHPVVAQHLVASGQRRPPVPKDNFMPWNQNENDNRPACPVKRPVERVAALAYVRVAFATCLGRKSKKDPLPPGPPDGVAAPTRQEFWVRWLEPFNSDFNTAACGIVTRQIMEDFPTLFTENCFEDLFKMVAAHMKYNILLYRRQHLPAGDISEAKRLAAASSNWRRHTIFQKRIYITSTVKALRRHRRLLNDLGIDGTSSDEEDPQTPGLYKVKRIKQLSSSVVQLKQKLDDAYEALVKVPNRKGSRGRKQVRTAESSSRKFRIKGLPVNCVNRIWYNRLSSVQKDVFRFADYEYDFKFPDEILKM
ncbi:unnamed protein product [Rhizoctonia solani]|uniref:Uncharacterized protein n=1 Tax=Rhizoctonia solani TaxID=456999 RepID=A0A8H3DRC7_9AGAM|nr:unnamed protein product [Rhizoctonia solani]